MLSMMLLGFLIGMRHALEADHVAAVASLATHSKSFGDTVRQGVVWGLGHSITLFAFGGAVVFANSLVPENLALWLELAVAVMLVILGVDVLRRVMRDHLHFHHHRHGDGQVHFHAHTHPGQKHFGEKHHDPDQHEHAHPAGFPFRALIVGLVHGMAGSAALILLTVSTVESSWMGLLYIALFGLGSIAGMAALSVVIAIPLRYSARGLTWLHNGLQITVGLATVALGITTLLTTGLI